MQLHLKSYAKCTQVYHGDTIKNVHLHNIINLKTKIMENRSGEVVSAQVAIFDDIDTKALTKEDFRLTNGQSFLIKNEGTEPIVLDVIPAGREEDTFVKCSFDMGWNPELVRAIKATSLSNLKIKYGY